VRLGNALDRARRAWRERPSIEAEDVLAWALARTGRCEEALGFSRRALRLRTLDAAKFFHRGMIERCLGRHADAGAWFRRALELNPHFSLVWAPVARREAA
jgi:tetratricopeptide (TPR) repeat protein